MRVASELLKVRGRGGACAPHLCGHIVPGSIFGFNADKITESSFTQIWAGEGYDEFYGDFKTTGKSEKYKVKSWRQWSSGQTFGALETDTSSRVGIPNWMTVQNIFPTMWFSRFFFLILTVIVEVYLWLQASLIFLSGRTCTIGGWLNTFLPHCMWGIQPSQLCRFCCEETWSFNHLSSYCPYVACFGHRSRNGWRFATFTWS